MTRKPLLIELQDQNGLERFQAKPYGYRRAQDALSFASNDAGAVFIAAFHNGNTHYLLTPEGGASVNGIDGRESVEETVKTYPSAESALRDAWRWRKEKDSVRICILSLTDEGESLIAREILGIAVSPINDSIGPVLHQHPDLKLNLREWATQEGLVR